MLFPDARQGGGQERKDLLGQVLPTLKNGRYAAKKKPQIIKRKFDAKWNADTNQILAIINK